MSQPLPIGDTLHEAFQFGIKRWGTVIRYAWAPIVISLLLVGLYFAAIVDFQTIAAAEDSESTLHVDEIFRASIPFMIALGVVLYVAVSMLFSGVMASVFRLAALGEERPGYVHLRLDGPAWRVFWATIISAVISLSIWGVALIISLASYGESIGAFLEGARSFFAALVAAAQTGAEPSFGGQADILDYTRIFVRAVAISIIPLIYVSVRLAPFLAGSAAENRLILFGSFNLTKGQFWPVFIAIIIMTVALMIIGFIYEMVRSLFELLMSLGQSGGAFAVIALVLAALYFAVTVFYYAFVYGVQFSFYGIMYRRLKTGE